MNANLKSILREMRDVHVAELNDFADRIEPIVKKQDRTISKMRSALQSVIDAHCCRGGVVNAHLSLDKCLPLLEKCSKAIEASK